MENKHSLSTFIKNNGTNHKRALIYLRATVNGKRAEISIKRSVDPSRWDSQANRMKGNKEDAKEINSLIDSTSLKINRIYTSSLKMTRRLQPAKSKKYLSEFRTQVGPTWYLDIASARLDFMPEQR